MPLAHIGPHQLNYRFVPAKRTEAPCLVLCNSIGTDMASWSGVAAALDGRYALLCHDTRGHGESTTDGRPCAMDDLGRDVLGLLDHLQITHAAVCGVSLGGMTALWLGLNAPQRFTHVIAAACAASTETPAFWDARIDLVQREGMQGLVDGVMSRFFSTAFRDGAPQVVADFRQRFLNTNPEGYTACCAAIRDLKLDEHLGRLDVPTLAMGGLRDEASPPDNSRAIAHKVQHGSHAELDTGHLIHVEAPEAFARLLTDFLR